MKLYELAEVEEARLAYITTMLGMGVIECSDVKGMIKMVRRELTGNERDLAMMTIGMMLKDEKEKRNEEET